MRWSCVTPLHKLSNAPKRLLPLAYKPVHEQGPGSKGLTSQVSTSLTNFTSLLQVWAPALPSVSNAFIPDRCMGGSLSSLRAQVPRVTSLEALLEHAITERPCCSSLSQACICSHEDNDKTTCSHLKKCVSLVLPFSPARF